MKIKIRDWVKNFERDRSSQWKKIQWVPIPNKQGAGYRKIIKQKNGLEIFACWICLIQTASLCETRGDLSKYSIDELSDLTMVESKTLQNAILFLSQAVDWVEVVENLDINVNNLDVDVQRTLPDSSILSDPILSDSIQSKNRGVRDSLYIGAELIYKEYPKKVGHKAAVASIEKALKTESAEMLFNITKLYAESVRSTERRFIPNPTTWYNQERWKDPISKDEPSIGGQQGINKSHVLDSSINFIKGATGGGYGEKPLGICCEDGEITGVAKLSDQQGSFIDVLGEA